MTKHYDPYGNELRPYSVRQPSHPLLPNFVPSEVEPHIAALEKANIYNDLTQEQQATIIRLMQQAYRNGQAHQGAEKIDNDCVWVNDVGMIERQADNTWIVTGYDAAKDAEMIRARDAELGIGYTIQQYNEWCKSYAARALRAIPSETRSEQSRINGKLGGRPRKIK
ncbi:MAG TPA: hypothetical protein VJL10_08880 [Anaerolineales bacterium]|nr:hypothetical protein [Anaerolineales bacterium]